MNERNPRAAELGEKMKEARVKRGWSQAKTAQKIGISKSHYQHLEQGYSDLGKASLPLRLQIERVLKWDIEER